MQRTEIRILRYSSYMLGLLFTVTASALDGGSELIKQLDTLRVQNNTPAYSLIITNKDETLLAVVRGQESARSAEPVDPGHWFRVGSITKTFVGLASLVAAEQGLLNLSQPVSEIIGPGYFTNPWVEGHPLTVEQLLEQTSGLPDMSKAEWDHNTPIALDAALKKFANQHTLQWPPGQFYSYSNTNYGLAGLVLEKTTQQPFEDFIAEKIFKPLAISKASLIFNSDVKKHLITGYNRDGKTPIPYWHTIYRPLGELSIAPDEMAKFLRMFLNRGAPIISAQQLARMETPQTAYAAQAGLEYGYGVGLYDWFVKGHRFYGHGGDGDGYLAHFAYSKASGLAYFLVINAFQAKPLRQMRAVIEAALIENVERPTKAPGLPLKNPDRYTGTYQPVTWRFGDKPADHKLTISLKGQQLMAKFSNETPYRLIAVGPGLFRWPVESSATMAMMMTPKGMMFIGDEGNYLKRSKLGDSLRE